MFGHCRMEDGHVNIFLTFQSNYLLLVVWFARNSCQWCIGYTCVDLRSLLCTAVNDNWMFNDMDWHPYGQEADNCSDCWYIGTNIFLDLIHSLGCTELVSMEFWGVHVVGFLHPMWGSYLRCIGVRLWLIDWWREFARLG